MTGDTNLDQVVDLYDLVTVAKHFGETYDSIISTAPKMLEVHAPVKVSMTAKHSISGDDDLSEQLLKLEPPFCFEGELPPVHQWHGAALQDGSGGSARATAGQILTGTGGSPGVVQGRARVVLDPSAPGDLGPGDVLVAPLTDPSWTPLFVPVEAVVVDVGGQMSHAVIVLSLIHI